MSPGDLVTVTFELDRVNVWELLTWDKRGNMTARWVRGRVPGTAPGFVTAVYGEPDTEKYAYVMFPNMIGWVWSIGLDVI